MYVHECLFICLTSKPVASSSIVLRAPAGSTLRLSQRRSARRAPVRAQKQPATTEPVEQTNIGFKWDGSNLRWVRDDRYAGVAKNTMIQPKTGPAYTIWPVVHAQLTAIGLKSVTAKEAYDMQQNKGWTIVDVRIAGDYEAEHCEDAINLPLYRFVQGTELWDNIKKFAMMGFAMKATERDPDYVAKAQATLKKGQKIIVVCAIGGTLDTKLRLRPDKYKDGVEDQDRAFGRESRALKAAYELNKAGWNSSNMVIMEGGLQQWKHQGFPLGPE